MINEEHIKNVRKTAEEITHGAGKNRAVEIYIEFYTNFKKVLTDDELKIVSHSTSSVYYCDLAKANYYRKQRR